MSQHFYQRFNIQGGLDEAKRCFVDRAHNLIIYDILRKMENTYGVDSASDLEMDVCMRLGKRWSGWGCMSTILGDDFFLHIHALEALYKHSHSQKKVDAATKQFLKDSEVDLGIRWKRGQFRTSGSALLDKKTVNDVLGLLDNPTHAGAAQAFHKGLDHFLHSTKKRELLSDVVNRMYESLEATAKIMCDNDKDLTGNAESFVSKVKLPDPYKRLLKEYMKYANDLHRHAAKNGKPKAPPSHREVEGFMYLTGIFIRLALSKET
jgi:hypothetical protein